MKKHIRTTNEILFPNSVGNKPKVKHKHQKRSEESRMEYTGGVVVPVARQEEIWECEVDIVKHCSKVPDNVTVKISPLVRKKITFLMKKFQGIEWLAYLIGTDLVVSDLFIPNQTVASASVNVDADTPLPMVPMIGVIHSHHGMGAFFSGTDDAYINGNHNISIVVSNTEMKAQVRMKTPCGALRTLPANVAIDFNVELDEVAFEKEVDDAVTKPYLASNFDNFPNWMNRYQV